MSETVKPGLIDDQFIETMLQNVRHSSAAVAAKSDPPLHPVAPGSAGVDRAGDSCAPSISSQPEPAATQVDGAHGELDVDHQRFDGRRARRPSAVERATWGKPRAVTISFPEGQYTEIERVASASGESVSTVVRAAVHQGLQRAARRLRASTTP